MRKDNTVSQIYHLTIREDGSTENTSLSNTMQQNTVHIANKSIKMTLNKAKIDMNTRECYSTLNNPHTLGQTQSIKEVGLGPLSK